MDAATKAQVLVVAPVRDEKSGVCDVGGITVARGQDQGEGGAGRDGGAGDLDVLEGRAGGPELD